MTRTKASDSGLRWATGFAVMVMMVTSLPYLLGFANEGAGWRFTGFVIGVEDGNSYIAKMLAGSAGDWLFYTPYTAYPQNGAIAFLPYILLGKLASPPGLHLQLVVLYHLFRFAAGILAILATYDFLSLFVQDLKLRRLGLILATLGGGLGWILVLAGKPYWLGSLPLEFYSPESFGFLSLFGLPHLAMARALLLWGLASYLRNAEANQSTMGGIRAGVLFLLLGFFQPLTVVIAWVVLTAHSGILALQQISRERAIRSHSWKSCTLYARRGIASILISSPIVAYTFIKFSSDPFLQNWTAQNLIISPPPGHYLAAYGLLVPFAMMGAYQLLIQKPFSGWLPVAWVLLIPFLAYAPYNLQRRLPEGAWVALVLLTIKGLEVWKPGNYEEGEKGKFAGKIRRSIGKASGSRKIIGLPLVLALPSTLILFVGGLQAVKHPGLPIFRPMEEVDAFQFLANYCEDDDIVLASFETGNALPAWTPVRVLIGHGPESIALEELRPQVKAFFDTSTTESERSSLLERLNVRFVFWGPNEKALGDWNPAKAGYLEPVYEQGEYMIFEVAELTMPFQIY